MINFDDFKKLEIRIGKVISVEKIPGTDKLLKFVFDLGNEQRQIHPEKEIPPGTIIK